MKPGGTNGTIKFLRHHSHGIEVRSCHRNKNIASLEALFCSARSGGGGQYFWFHDSLEFVVNAADIDVDKLSWPNRTTLVDLWRGDRAERSRAYGFGLVGYGLRPRIESGAGSNPPYIFLIRHAANV